MLIIGIIKTCKPPLLFSDNKLKKHAFNGIRDNFFNIVAPAMWDIIANDCHDTTTAGVSVGSVALKARDAKLCYWKRFVNLGFT